MLKNAAYCAIFTLLAGCAATNSELQNAGANDALQADKVRQRAQAIPNLAAAQRQEQAALAQQAAADQLMVNIESLCMPKFLVNKCIDDARTNRNAAWDAAQIDLTAARLHIRTLEANQRRVELAQKLAAYTAEEKANAPIRAANQAEFAAKQAAFAQRQAEYAAEQIALAPERAANVSAFEARRLKILEIQKKREADNKKRVEDAAAKKP